MSVDTKNALRHSLCLANLSAMQGAKWGRLDTRQALRPGPGQPQNSPKKARGVSAIDLLHSPPLYPARL